MLHLAKIFDSSIFALKVDKEPIGGPSMHFQILSVLNFNYYNFYLNRSPFSDLKILFVKLFYLLKKIFEKINI